MEIDRGRKKRDRCDAMERKRGREREGKGGGGQLKRKSE